MVDFVGCDGVRVGLVAAWTGDDDVGHAGRCRFARGAVHYWRGVGTLANVGGSRTCACAFLRDYLPVALFKLLLLGLGSLLIALGLPLAPSALTVIVLVAALPSASNVSLLAERFCADNGRIARIILMSTAAAFVTFTLAAT